MLKKKKNYKRGTLFGQLTFKRRNYCPKTTLPVRKAHKVYSRSLISNVRTIYHRRETTPMAGLDIGVRCRFDLILGEMPPINYSGLLNYPLVVHVKGFFVYFFFPSLFREGKSALNFHVTAVGYIHTHRCNRLYNVHYTYWHATGEMHNSHCF